MCGNDVRTVKQLRCVPIHADSDQRMFVVNVIEIAFAVSATRLRQGDEVFSLSAKRAQLDSRVPVVHTLDEIAREEHKMVTVREKYGPAM